MDQTRHIDTSGLPKGFDAADLIEQGISEEELLAWMKERVRPGPPKLLPGDKEKPKAAAKPKSPPKTPAKGQKSNVVPLEEPDAEDDEGLPVEFSEDRLAEKFTENYHKIMAYCGPWTAWLHWTGNKWEVDETGLALDFARKICRETALNAESRYELGAKRERIATALSARKTMAAVEGIAKTDRRHVVRPAQIDADPWVLNTPDGCLDLKTGQIRQARREDWCLKQTAVGPGNGDCPIWKGFLQDCTQGDSDLIAYLKRVAGYCLTGSIAEHVFFFAYGTGGNGKGTFLNQLYWLLNSYAVQAKMETFIETKFVQHSAEIAVLQGARLVAASETGAGQRWAESRIKAMTGGDPITANFMRRNPFTFLPTFKLLFAGNHRPHLRQVDEAIKRRLYLIPFDFKVPREQKDLALPDKLKEEGPAILRWCIEGCLEWQKKSLDPPDRVVAVTREYFANEDKLAAFLEDCTQQHIHGRVSSARLYERYCRWAEGAGEYAGTRKDFLELMRLKGYEPVKKSGAMLFLGLEIVNDDQTVL